MKTHDPEVDELLEKLCNPCDGGPSAAYEMVVNADVAERAAEMIFMLYNRLASFGAEDYDHRQMMDY